MRVGRVYNPTLNELWLFEIYHDFFTHDAPPFVSSLVKEYQRQNYQDPFVISAVGLRRAKANGLSSQEWLVTEITMRTGHLLTNNLSLLASSFPELEVLRLNFDSDLGKYDNEDLSSVFAQFSYLRVVHIMDIVRRLPFGSEIENRMRPGRQVETTPTLHEIRVGAERELLAFISCVAKQVRTLDLVYIDDAGSGYDDDEEYIQLWGFKGWFHAEFSTATKVLNSCHSLRLLDVDDLQFLRPSPFMYLPLPNELLHSIIEFIIYTPRLPRALRSSFQRPPPELLALSVANWQLRRACLPFLCAKIKISNNKDAKQLENHLALCAKFIKALFIGSYGITQVVEEYIISQILPQLEQLLEVELGRCSKHTDLLKALLAHPSVTSVLVDEMPDESICNHDVSKMILDRSSLPSPADEKYFDRGMRLKRLSLDVDSDSIDDELETVNFPGVETIEIDMYDNLVSFSWLSRFLSKHPTLNELWLLEIEDSDLFTHDESPFLALAQEYQPPHGTRPS
ncbi:hypothetical protein F5880DRAFT_1619139 [Lentinula raphanica]|nr:hypothetical protein F5880DRAFT_1619139 [Lentinula raphanica]